jgi:hypothetical protein
MALLNSDTGTPVRTTDPGEVMPPGRKHVTSQVESDRDRSCSCPLADGFDLRIGDCREVMADVAPNSIPLILTDPPYELAAEPLWRWLGTWAMDVLIPGGSLICYFGGAHTNLLYSALDAARLKHFF